MFVNTFMRHRLLLLLCNCCDHVGTPSNGYSSRRLTYSRSRIPSFLGSTEMEMVMARETQSAVRPFRVEVSQAALDDLRSRVLATRWPTKELVDDRSQGVQQPTLRELARYGTTEYDWRDGEARLNALPQFRTKIDGVDIHFIHVRSKHENALPLIMTHGWPGSVVELLDTIGPLTDPTSHGGTPEDAFPLVLPSCRAT